MSSTGGECLSQRPILSVVVPCYNCEEFVADCLHSAFRELSRDSEVLLIDDGSTDRSLEIIEREFAQQIEAGQLKVHSQENQGPGAARNFGIEHAEGRYIGFLDSDDILLSGFFETVTGALNDPEVDIVEFGVKRFVDAARVVDAEALLPPLRFEKVRMSESRAEYFAGAKWFPCSRVYRASCWDGVRFPVGVFYEDFMTVPFVFLKDVTVLGVGESFIGYRVNPNGTTENHSAAHADDLLQFIRRLEDTPRSVATDILKTQAAMTIVYFQRELGGLNFDVREVHRLCASLAGKKDLMSVLPLREKVFLRSPSLYSIAVLMKLLLRRAK